MPVISVKLWDLARLVGRELERGEIFRYMTALKCEIERMEGGELEYEANHDRPDLFSAEGLARAIRGLMSKGDIPLRYRVADAGALAYADHVPGRPYAAFAIVRDVSLDEEAIIQIMQLQEKLATTYGRNRRKASIGVYDLDKIELPVYYTTADPDATRFTPLNEKEEMSLREALRKTAKGMEYGHLVEGMQQFPIIKDSAGNVVSFPPIINADYNKVTDSTRNILIDSTGLDPNIVVDMVTIMATSIAERSGSGVIEVITTRYPSGLSLSAPREKGAEISLRREDVIGLIGVEISERDIGSALRSHYYELLKSDERDIVVRAPVYRLDVRTWVDVAEDIATAIGYDILGSLADSLPPSGSPGRVHPLEYLSRKARDLMISLGFTEVANYMMSNEQVQLELLGAEWEVFRVSNPRSERFTCVRAWLAPELIMTAFHNARKRPRLSIFEIGDVVVPDPQFETYARVERRIGFVITHEKATLTDGLAVVKSLMSELGLPYSFEKGRMPGFLAERTAKILVNGREVGFVGEVHPAISAKFEHAHPVVVGEITLNKLLDFFTYS